MGPFSASLAAADAGSPASLPSAPTLSDGGNETRASERTTPTVTAITRLSATPTNSSSVTFTVSFSERVVDLDPDDFTPNAEAGVSEASVSTVSTSGSDTTVTVTGINGDGSLGLDVSNSGNAQDTEREDALGLSEPPTDETYTVDNTTPTVTAITRSTPTAETTDQSSITFAVSFSEKVEDLDPDDFTFGSNPGGATIDAINTPGDTTITVTGISGDGFLDLDVSGAGTTKDPAGNGLASSAPSTEETYTIDQTAPRVTAITRTLDTPTNADSVAFQVSFSETVTGLNGSDFTLSSAPDGGASITDISTTDDTTVAVEFVGGSGTLDLDVSDDGSAQDPAGNGLDTTTEPDPDQTYTVDNTPPAITGDVTAPDGSYAEGEVVSFTVPYGETVEVDESGGTPALALDVDGTTREADLDSGSGTNSLVFNYTVQPGDSTLALNTSNIQLNGGTITDPAGNNANLGFSGQTDLSGVFIDGTAPPIVNRVLSNDGSNNLTFQFETNEPLDAIDVTVDGPNTADVYSFDESDFTETTVSGDFDIQYTLSTPPPYDDGRGTYAATIDAAVDTVGNDGSTGTSVPYELPAANDQSFTTDEDTELSVDAPGVLSNDSPLNPEDDSVSVLRVQGSSENRGNDITLDSDAVLTLNEDGSFTYDPAGAFEDFAATDDSTDTFEYQAIGPDGGTSNTATVSVTINGVNDAPQIATNSVLGLPSGSEAVISDDILQVDDPDNGAATLTFTLEDEPVNGDLLNNGTPLNQGDTFSQQDINDGKIKYDHGGSGETDNFDFTVSDGDKGISETEFTISIGTNDPPTANNDNATTTEDDVLDVTDPSNGVLANDNDDDPEDDLFVSEVNGTPNEENPVTVRGNSDIVIDSSGTYTFDPKDEFQSLDDGENATPVVTYTAADGRGGRAQASLNLTVEGKNDPPTLVTNDGLDGVRIGARESILSLNLRAEDVDENDGASNLTFEVQTPPNNGRLFNGGSPLNANDTFTQADINDGNIAYQHDGSTTSSDSFTFTLTDDSGAGPSEATFAISISAGIPTARNDTFVVGENSSLAVTSSGAGVLDNDSDPTQDDLTASIVALTGPENGTLDNLTNFSDGFFTYTPDDGFSGRDSVDYSATDPAENADTAAVQIAVLPATEQYVTTQGQAVSIPAPDTAVLGPEAGQAVDTLGEVSVSSAPSDGSVTFSDDTFEYTPDNGFSGTDAFEYEVGNGLGGTVSAGISVRVRASQPSISINRSFPNPTDSTSFRLVALPGSPGVSLASTLPGEQGEDWRGFREGGATENASFSREPCGTEATCSLTAGTGYWLIARSDWSVDDNIGAVSLQPDDGGPVPSVVRIPVQDGWNIISNPLVEDVSWEAVQDASGTDQDLFRWRDGWLEAQTFGSATSGEAYYFRDDQIDELVVPFPGVQRKDAPEKTDENTKSSPTAKGQALALHVVQDGDTLSSVRAGRHPDSKRGFDDTDRYGPPGYFGASLRLLPPGAEQPPALRTEYKPPNGDGSAFDLRLRTSADSAVTLTTEGADAFADDQVALVNRSSGRSHDLKATPAVTVAPSSSTTRFKLLVGSDAFVDKAQQEAVPDEVKLRPNYPNPFRRTTTIEYSLPSAQDVRLVIYDVLGRRVETIVDGRKEAGFHTLQWDGGRSLASGMYFARLVAGSTTKTERLVIIR